MGGTVKPVWAILVLMTAGTAARADAQLCDLAAQRVAAESGVPAAVLLAITRVETGRTQGGQLRPWPWTTNTQGNGAWFETREQAVAQARAAIARGQTSIDLGCFQINWRWHGQEFDDPAQLFDPLVAGRYAARLLGRLHDELGTWTAAAGAYHSRTPAPNARYRARFAQVLAGLSDAPVSTPLPPPGAPATRGTLASLVPLPAQPAQPFIIGVNR